jgi:hypothetical protein
VKSTRTAVASALLLTPAAGIGHAEAATKAKPKPMCNNVTDPAGDVGLYGGTPVTPDDALDIKSADLGSSAKGVTAAIRLVKLGPAAPTSPAAAVYELRFEHRKSGEVYSLWASVTGGQATFGVGTVDTSAQAEMATSTGTATGTIDTARNEIRIYAPYSALGGAKPGVKVSIDDVIVKRGAPTNYYGRYADEGAASKSFTFGTPTCVKLGG